MFIRPSLILICIWLPCLLPWARGDSWSNSKPHCIRISPVRKRMYGEFIVWDVAGNRSLFSRMSIQLVHMAIEEENIAWCKRISCGLISRLNLRRSKTAITAWWDLNFISNRWLRSPANRDVEMRSLAGTRVRKPTEINLHLEIRLTSNINKIRGKKLKSITRGVYWAFKVFRMLNNLHFDLLWY